MTEYDGHDTQPDVERWLAELGGPDEPHTAELVPVWAPPSDYPSDVDLLSTLAPQTLAMEGRTDLAFARMQMERAIAYSLARQRGDQMRVTSRAGVILAARWDSPEIEQTLGVRCCTDEYRGQTVGCRLCLAEYVAGVTDDYYDATSATDGLCFGCVLLDTRTDDALTELVGTVVAKPVRAQAPSRRMPRGRRRDASES